MPEQKRVNSPPLRPITRAKANSYSNTYPCGSAKCIREVTSTGIQCDACKCWYHKICSRLKAKTFTLHTTLDELQWYCPECVTQLIKLISSHGRPAKAEVRGESQTDLSNKKEIELPANVEAIDVTNDASDAQQVPSPKPATLQEIALVRTSSEAVGQVNHTDTQQELKTVTESTIPQGRSLDMVLRDTNLEEVYSKLEAQDEALQTLRNEHQALLKGIDKLQHELHASLGRHRNIVIYGVPERFIKENKSRIDDMQHHVRNLLRIGGTPQQVSIKRIFRLGRWNGIGVSQRTPRPLLVEFVNPLHRDRLLSVADLIRLKTCGTIKIVPDLSPKNPEIYCHQKPSVAEQRPASEMNPVDGRSLSISVPRLHTSSDQEGARSSAHETPPITEIDVRCVQNLENSKAIVQKNGASPRA
jgi:hypothetical protein